MTREETTALAPPALFGVERSIGGKRWRLRDADDSAAREIARLTGCPDAVARMLAARGVAPAEAARFLDPRLKHVFPDPSSFQDMDRAAELIWDALDAGRKIAVFADYDVDGATSAAQLLRWMRALGHDGLHYVPDRVAEGYGPNTQAFKRLKAQGAELIITVDCGAAAVEPLQAAAGLGLSVVVVDHHLMSEAAPPADALVNPNRPDDRSGCGHLAAAGVSFVLLAALNREGRRRGRLTPETEPDLLSFLEFAALGTVCDVVSLTGLNRALVAQGLKRLSVSDNPGLRALRAVSGAEGQSSPYEAGFLLGPRINAGGRIGQADLGVRLLSTDDAEEAMRLAEALDGYNAERKAIEAAALEDALARVERDAADAGEPVLIAAGEGWHPGIVGIVAGRMKDRYNRPSIVIGLDPETGLGKGSGRSCSGVDLGTAISAAREAGLLLAGGGHAMAGGLTIEAGKIDAFRTFMRERLAQQWSDADEARTLTLDGVLSPGAVTFDLWRALQQAGPFGMGHAEPRFGFDGLRKTFAKRVGRDHVRASFQSADGTSLGVIAFRCADGPMGEALLAGGEGPWRLAGRIKGEDGRFGRKADLQLEDLAPAQ